MESLTTAFSIRYVLPRINRPGVAALKHISRTGLPGSLDVRFRAACALHHAVDNFRMP
jgi:hypothetical protein